MGKYLVGIDEGTMSCKTCVFDLEGNLVASCSREYPCYAPKPGYVEQDIDEIRDRVFESCKGAITNAAIDPADILGVGFSNQGLTFVLIDENGNHLRDRTIGWQDIRHAEMLPQLREKIDAEEYFRLVGVPLGAYNTSVLNWLQKYEPEMWKKVYKVCSHQDYFLKQLGAEDYYIDEGSANFIGMLDVDTREWSPRAYALYGLRPEQLPIVAHQAGQVVGRVGPEVAEKTGLPVGCRVCVGANDANCCSFATGGVEKGIDIMVVGTAGASTLICEKPVRDPEMRIDLRGNQGMDSYMYFAMTHTASSFRWFRDMLCALEVAVGKLMDDDPYNIITKIAATSRPGANGVTALVCFQGVHVHRNNDYAQGTLLGITLGTTKADLAQAILEGICFEMYSILKLKERLVGDVSLIRLCGGVAKSPYWCQMFADIMRRPIELTSATELGSLGAAMYAGVGTGVYADCRDAAQKCVHVTQRYFPNPNTFSAYDAAFRRWNEAYDTVCGADGFYHP